MAMKISYFIIIGIVTVTNGKPAGKTTDTYLVKDELELEKLLHTLAKQGKYTIPSSHNEDKASRQRELRHNPNNRANYGQYYSSSETVGKGQDELKLINQIFAQNTDKYPALQNAQNLLEDLLHYRENDDNANADASGNADVADLLNDIQRNLADDGSYVSQLRCAGNRCQDKRVSAGDRDDDRDDLRCNGKNCARSKDDSEIDFADVRSNDNLVCIGDKCTRTESDGQNNPDGVDGLRCNGKNCARSRYDDKEGNLRYNSKQLANKIKISDDLDAVVLGMSDVDRLLTNLNAPRQQRTHKVSGTKLVQNIDLNRLLNSKSIANKKTNVEAVVFDLTQVDNGDAVAKQIKQVLSHDDNASDQEYDEYGNFVEDNLKNDEYNLDKSTKGTSKILPHNEGNNNVYIPQWLLDEVVSKTNVRARYNKQLMKNLLPFTKQQKARQKEKNNKKQPTTTRPRKIFRRSFDQDVGVPFHLEVQGLGQVNP